MGARCGGIKSGVVQATRGVSSVAKTNDVVVQQRGAKKMNRVNSG